MTEIVERPPEVAPEEIAPGRTGMISASGMSTADNASVIGGTEAERSDAGLTLWRLAIVAFRPPPAQDNWFGADFGEVQVQTLGSWEADGTLTVLIAAGVKLQYRPKLAGGRLIVVPTPARRKAEQAIEAIADLVSVSDRCARNIASPFPCVALEPHGENARRWLEATHGIHEFDRILGFTNHVSRVVLNDEILGGLTDRSDGIRLLAEAFAQVHPTGRFHDLFRVFERAFALPARQLCTPLLSLLHTRYGYTQDEIDAWLDLRDAATHADARRTFVVEADLRPVLRRVEQAAIDVILNKELWRHSNPGRRELWAPEAWTKNPSGDGVAILHAKGRVEGQLLDQFGAYPIDLAADVLRRLPKGWWAPIITTQRTQARPFRVLPEGQREE